MKFEPLRDDAQVVSSLFDKNDFLLDSKVKGNYWWKH